jgi:hypothetical protein
MGRDGRARGKLTAAQARGHLKAWKESGNSLTAYARSVGMSFQRLHRWRRKLYGVGRAADCGFVPVQVVGGIRDEAAASSETGFELISRSGVRVRLGPGFDEGALERLLRIVEQASC